MTVTEMKRGSEYSGHYRYMVTFGKEYYFHDDEMVANRAAISNNGKLWVLAQLGTTTYKLVITYD